ncbi:hydrocephalus-inducing protein-like [Melanerpes formicivorus]|uniref:hydrocephalus-inducing protein-like n=1 Tax=Melanerpes formicivorus TaxID=211600 RepID=UPI00358E66FB
MPWEGLDGFAPAFLPALPVPCSPEPGPLWESTKTSSGSSKEAPGRQQSIPKRRTEKGSAQECSASAAPGREEEEQQSKLGLADSCSGEQSEQSLALRFQSYEASRQHVAHLLSCWDRVQGVPAEPGVLQPAGQQQPSPRLRRQKSRKELQKRLGERKLAQLEGEGAAGAGGGQAVGVPCLDIEVLSCADVLSTILESRRLPRPEQGPPLPPTAFYSVAHYPAKRELPVAEAEQHFVLLPQGAPGPEEEAASVRTVKFSEEQGAPGRGHWRGARASSSQEAVRRKRSSGDGRRALRRSATVASIHPSEEGRRPTGTVPAPESCARSSSYRWVVPAQGQVVLQVHFSSALLGSFEQRLHFELLGTKRPYQLHCRGSCLYPTISQEPREVFPRCRQSKAAEAILSKEYVLGTRVFHFGPLLCGKARERSKAVLQAGNREQLSIRNVSPWEAEVHFSWERGWQQGHLPLGACQHEAAAL